MNHHPTKLSAREEKLVRKIAHEHRAQTELFAFRAIQEETGLRAKVRRKMEIRQFRKSLAEL